jgi:hypothetical protein
MIENCGLKHVDYCECEVACPACGGKVEELSHICNCNRCDDEGEDEYRCVACLWVGDEFEVSDLATAVSQYEKDRLTEWHAWAVASGEGQGNG